MSNFVTRAMGFSLAALFLALLAGPAAAQGVVITFDLPIFTFVRPLVGTSVENITGTVDVQGANLDITARLVEGPREAGGDFFGLLASPTFDAYVAGLNPGVDFSGHLFSIQIASTDALGDYFFDNSLANPPDLILDVFDLDVTFQQSGPYFVRIVAGGAAAPEPGALALLLPALVGGTIVLRRR